jgi:hypothetical protein
MNKLRVRTDHSSAESDADQQTCDQAERAERISKIQSFKTEKIQSRVPANSRSTLPSHEIFPLAAQRRQVNDSYSLER